MIDLDTIKRSQDVLFSILRIDSDGDHKTCPFHADGQGASGSLRVKQDSKSGVWLWKCYRGCGSGSVIDAYKVAGKHRDNSAAIAAMEKELGLRFSKESKERSSVNLPPIINIDAAEAFVQKAHKALMEDIDTQIEYVTNKRHIEMYVVELYRIGFIKNYTFDYWRNWTMPAAWVLPITDRDGKLRCVKLHFEVRPDLTNFKTKTTIRNGGPKCMFAPFGIKQDFDDKPRHSWMTLWPPPEDFPASCEVNGQTHQDWFYLCPGELKSLAHISIAQASSSMTGGEGAKLPPSESRRLTGRRLSLEYDNDDAGRKWKEQRVDDLKSVASEIEVRTLGNK